MHQVSGHSHMFVYDSTTVCKPMCEREYDFYSTLPKKLLPFTAEFKGVIEVDARENRDGDITLVGLPECLRKLQTSNKMSTDLAGNSPGSSGEGGNDDSDSDSGSSSAQACCKRTSLEKAGVGGKKTSSRDKMVEQSSGTLFENHGGSSKVKPVSAGTRNPWSIRCHSIRLDEIRRADKSYKGRKFILLENVVSQFGRPCVLDLKMGTRQYGDDETDEKRERKNRRCMTTTSAKLGIRMCGMQVYQTRSHKYICRDKYFGRKVSEEGLHDILHQFLHNGARIRTELIDEIIAKLQTLHSLVFKQNTFRFYSSSLLIMYDGISCEDSSESESSDQEAECSNTSCSVKHTSSNKDPSWSSRLPAKELDRVHRGSSASESETNNTDYDEASSASGKSPRREVDVKMIDFAHTTGQGMSQHSVRTKHHGPDTGYLIGLENLIKMFGEIKRQEQQEES